MNPPELLKSLNLSNGRYCGFSEPAPPPTISTRIVLIIGPFSSIIAAIAALLSLQPSASLTVKTLVCWPISKQDWLRILLNTLKQGWRFSCTIAV